MMELTNDARDKQLAEISIAFQKEQARADGLSEQFLELQEAIRGLAETWKIGIAELRAGIKHSPSHDLQRMIKERVEAFTICITELLALLPHKRDEAGAEFKGCQMSIECSECERDLRGGHAEKCSRYVRSCDNCIKQDCDEECQCNCHSKKSIKK